MPVEDMVVLIADWTAILEDGETKKFRGTLYLLYCGLPIFMKVVYPTWVRVEYRCEIEGQTICSGTVLNTERMYNKPLC